MGKEFLLEVMRKTGNKQKSNIFRRFGVISAVTLLLLTAGCGKKEEELPEGPETAKQGVWIDNYDVSGMTYEQITEVIDQDMAERSGEKIYLSANGMAVAVTAGELGLHCTDPNLAMKALNFGKDGSMIQQFKGDSYIAKNGSYILDLPYAVTEENVRAVIQEKTPALSEGSGGSTLIHNDDGSFTVIPGEKGKTVELESSVAKVVDYMDHEWTGGVGSASLNGIEDDISAEVEALEMVQDCLGSYTTHYETSEVERSHNIEFGTSKLNGIILYPGQSISVCTMLEPFTAEEGYQPAHAYEQGSIIDSIGGGVCQISSTLYNAVLRAELQVDERAPHSMMVGYIEPSLDAAIAENTKDLVFTNNTDAPILIEGTAANGDVTFFIYGHETRDPGRTLTFESAILEKQDFTYEFELDPGEDVGAYDISSPRDGLKAEGYKNVYQNGELISRELISKTEYRMAPQIYTIGIRGASDSEIQLLSEAAATGDKDVVFSAIGVMVYNHPNAKTEKQKKEEEKKKQENGENPAEAAPVAEAAPAAETAPAPAEAAPAGN